MQLTDDIAFAVRTVRRAAVLVREIQAELTATALAKKDRSPVTVADFAAQALVAHELQASERREPLVAEETADSLQHASANETLREVTRFLARRLGDLTPQATCDLVAAGQAECQDRFWTLDPVDGTKGFLRGEQYAVCLALVSGGEVLLGAMACPNLNAAAAPEIAGEGSVYYAARGHGACAAPLDRPDECRTLRVSAREDPAEARLLRSVEAGHTDADKIGQFSLHLGLEAAPVCMDSQAKYAVLAAGEGEILLRLLSPARPDYREKIWDQAAGSILVTEAGGKVTDLAGTPLDFSRGRTLASNRGVLVTNGRLHARCLAALSEMGG